MNVEYIISEFEKNINFAKKEIKFGQEDKLYWQGYKEALQYALDRVKSLRLQ